MAISAYLIERASQRPPILSLMVAIVAVRFFGIARGVFRYVDRYLSHDASFRLLGEIRGSVYQILIPLVPGYAVGRTVGHGEVLARISADVDTLQEWFVRGFAPLSSSILSAAFVMVAASILLPAAGLALLCAFVVAAVIVISAVGSGRRSVREDIELRGRYTDGLVDYLHGLPDLVAMGAAGMLANRLDRLALQRDRWSARVARRAAVATALQASLPGLVAAMLGAVAIAGLGSGLDPLMVGVLVFGAMAAVECVAALSGAIDSWHRGVVAAHRLADLTGDGEVRVQGSRFTASQLPGESRQSLSPAVQGSCRTTSGTASPRTLSIRHVSFGYQGACAVLQDLSLQVDRGDRIVISGPSGAGKTTLANLLLRFLEPSAGSIDIDGTALTDFNEPGLRRTVGAATQDAHLFTGSIRNNIMLARPTASESELELALTQAQLAGWVAGLPSGLDTEVGERGLAVSGGQRRRIVLARAFLAGFSFLIADEPTEGLDTPTARDLVAILFQGSHDRGLIVITHRPDLCPRNASFYRLVAGRLVPCWDAGATAATLATAGSYFPLKN